MLGKVLRRRWIVLAIVVAAAGSVLALESWNSALDAALATGDYVILLHGLGRTQRSMRKMEARLTRAGYRVINLSLPTRSHSIAQLTDEYVRPVRA